MRKKGDSVSVSVSVSVRNGFNQPQDAKRTWIVGHRFQYKLNTMLPSHTDVPCTVSIKAPIQFANCSKEHWWVIFSKKKRKLEISKWRRSDYFLYWPLLKICHISSTVQESDTTLCKLVSLCSILEWFFHSTDLWGVECALLVEEEDLFSFLL